MDALSRLAATFILNALWQVTLIAVLALLVDRFLRHAPARFRHTLWVLALAAAIVVPVASLRPLAMPRGSVTYALGAAVPLREAAPNRLSANFWQAAKSWVKDARQDGIPLPQPWARVLLALYTAFLGLQLVRLGRAWSRTREIGRRASSGVPAHITAIAEECRGAIMCQIGVRRGSFIPPSGWRGKPAATCAPETDALRGVLAGPGPLAKPISNFNVG